MKMSLQVISSDIHTCCSTSHATDAQVHHMLSLMGYTTQEIFITQKVFHTLLVDHSKSMPHNYTQNYPYDTLQTHLTALSRTAWKDKDKKYKQVTIDDLHDLIITVLMNQSSESRGGFKLREPYLPVHSSHKWGGLHLQQRLLQ